MRVGKEVPGFDIILFGHDHARHEETLDTSDGRQVLFLNPANNAVSIADASIELTLRKGKVVDKKIEGKMLPALMSTSIKKLMKMAQGPKERRYSASAFTLPLTASRQAL